MQRCIVCFQGDRSHCYCGDIALCKIQPVLNRNRNGRSETGNALIGDARLKIFEVSKATDVFSKSKRRYYSEHGPTSDMR